jgi:cytochrome c peroxidase
MMRHPPARGVLLGASAVVLLAVAGVPAAARQHRTTAPPPAPSAVPFDWDLPPGFPEPVVPTDNPMTVEKVALGRHLFYDTRLSGNGTQSCASCHDQALAFSDPLARAVGSTGEVHPRGSMSLANVAYSPVLTWANPLLRSLEQQALIPMFGEDPVELGLAGQEAALFARLRAVPRYRELFAAAYPGERDPFSVASIVKALGAFQRTLISGRSPYDRYQQGDSSAISASARRGEAIFFSEQAECFHCHGGFNFTGTVNYVDKGFVEIEFHNTGLYNIDGQGAYPEPNTGVAAVTTDPEDMGRFKAPSLRNVALTAPYMHDGSVRTLEDVIEHYDAGGRTITSGPHAGVGADNPYKSEFLKPMGLTAQQKRDLISFLECLTDSTFLRDPRFSNPWSAPR